ncbi:techylectin-5A [Caerostris extrusa]|uniref:Techylectin-5A n=1 Tax=Caerostris extrusa TaxID=172846 RepID=A0AAV4MHA2_CAEEX|nr:techylectin-5A [Caerostris extrusa]
MFMINLNFDLFPDYFRRKTYFYGAICVLSALGLIILTVNSIPSVILTPDLLLLSIKRNHGTAPKSWKRDTTRAEYIQFGPRVVSFWGKPINVYCDMDIPNEGWTVIQRRFLGSQKFNLKWRNYKHGFGNIMKEFWLGNENIFAMTNQGNCEVRFDLKTPEGEHRYAIYSNFRIDDDLASYTLHISGYSGNAGDGMKHHNGHRFVTKDNDQDEYARSLQGAWWFSEFPYVHLNGLYRPFVEKLEMRSLVLGAEAQILN